MIISSEPADADKAADIPVSEGVQETYLKDSDAEVVDDLVPEYYEAALFQLGGDYDHGEEPPWKDITKYDHSKTRKDMEVIQAARNLVDLKQVIKGEEEVGSKNRGDNL